MSLVPEREREQPPELAAQVLAARDVVVDQPGHGLGPEVALAPQRLGRERLAREGLEVAAQPCRGRDREAALAPAQQLRRDQRRRRLAQEDLLAQPVHLVPIGEPERESRHERVEERDARLEGVRHRRPVGLREQVVDEIACRRRRPGAAPATRRPRSRRNARAGGRPGRSRRRGPSARLARPARRSPSSRDAARAAGGARPARTAWPCSRSWPSRSTRAAARRRAAGTVRSEPARSASRSAAYV